MKKVISLLLAVLMIFSVATVAFATDAPAEDTNTEVVDPDAPAEDGTEGEEGEESVIPDLGEYDWILDLPFWTVGPAFKFAKIALKLVNVYLKVAKIFGLVDQDMGDMILGAIIDLIQNAENGEQTEEPSTEPSTEAPAPAPAA